MRNHGFYKIDISLASPNIDVFLANILLIGIGQTSGLPNENTSIRANLAGDSCLCEITIDDVTLDIDVIKTFILSQSSLTQQEVDSMITGFTNIGDDEAARAFILSEISQWQIPIGGM